MGINWELQGWGLRKKTHGALKGMLTIIINHPMTQPVQIMLNDILRRTCKLSDAPIKGS